MTNASALLSKIELLTEENERLRGIISDLVRLDDLSIKRYLNVVFTARELLEISPEQTERRS